MVSAVFIHCCSSLRGGNWAKGVTWTMLYKLVYVTNIYNTQRGNWAKGDRGTKSCRSPGRLNRLKHRGKLLWYFSIRKLFILCCNCVCFGRNLILFGGVFFCWLRGGPAFTAVSGDPYMLDMDPYTLAMDMDPFLIRLSWTLHRHCLHLQETGSCPDE